VTYCCDPTDKISASSAGLCVWTADVSKREGTKDSLLQRGPYGMYVLALWLAAIAASVTGISCSASIVAATQGRVAGTAPRVSCLVSGRTQALRRYMGCKNIIDDVTSYM
jgi:hypothetical protein